jgi:nitroreductase
MNEVIELLKSHRSIRQYTDKSVDDEAFRAILEAAQSASTSNYVQAYTIIRVNDMQKRKDIAIIAGSQTWIEKAPLFLVFCADLNRLELACQMHGKNMATGYVEQFIVATVDTALMAQNAMIAAESMGLGGVFIGGIRNDPEKVCALLEIPDNAYPVFGMCLGHPDDDPLIKPRLSPDAILKTDSYGSKQGINALESYDEVTNRYYLSRNSNLKDQTWSRQMADFMSQIIRPHMKSFLESKEFCLR